MEQEGARARGRGGEDDEWPEIELNYDDSSVKRYECEAVRMRVKQADLSRGVRELAPIEGASYFDNNLKKIYSMSFRPCGKLVAAGERVSGGDVRGGSGGRVWCAPCFSSLHMLW